MEATRSYLVALLEETAVTLGLDRGSHRLELCFENGRMRSWWAHAERRPPGELAAYDDVVGDLLERARARACRAFLES